MKNIYITIVVVIITSIVGAVFIFGKGKNVEAPVGEIQQEIPKSPSTTKNIITTPAIKEFIVSGKNFSFTPTLLTVSKGDRVKIIFQNSAGFHDFVIDEYWVATKQAQSPTTEVLEFTADKVGSFEYYCSVGSHRKMGMKGTLIVQ
ncbi:hypothetical protein EXS45_01140 [Candidatus Nomurabacteria bacterium]|nr:hypothetical protein [Candidatus Nomurabacteria bacterium]